MRLGDFHFPTVSAPDTNILFQDQSLYEPKISNIGIAVLELVSMLARELHWG